MKRGVVTVAMPDGVDKSLVDRQSKLRDKIVAVALDTPDGVDTVTKPGYFLELRWE
jgi:hypothetical protein